jgi:hypothetical protein
VHCELFAQTPQVPDTHTWPVAQSPLPEQGPQVPEALQTSPVAQSETFEHGPHTPATQA